jgi:hypothetical protein
MSREVAVVGLGLFVPELAGVSAWAAQGRDPARAEPVGAFVKPRDRRRMSALSKALADAYAEALAAAGLASSGAASVFGSALGEAATMIGLLDQMWSEGGALSPMRFVSSVHNAAAGVVSIAAQNQGFTTSLGADYDTPAMALVEGLGFVLARGEPVVVCCGDEPVPGELVPEELRWALLAAAVALAPVEAAPPGSARIALSAAAPTLPPCGAPTAIARNPNVGLLDLIDALHHRREGVLRLDRGRGRGFSVELRIPAP